MKQTVNKKHMEKETKELFERKFILKNQKQWEKKQANIGKGFGIQKKHQWKVHNYTSTAFDKGK